jgi:hypothetical protein
MIHSGHHAATAMKIQLCFSGGAGFRVKSLAVADSGIALPWSGWPTLFLQNKTCKAAITPVVSVLF